MLKIDVLKINNFDIYFKRIFNFAVISLPLLYTENFFFILKTKLRISPSPSAFFSFLCYIRLFKNWSMKRNQKDYNSLSYFKSDTIKKIII